jgi:DNA-binding NarL/FixJ family response regulator
LFLPHIKPVVGQGGLQHRVAMQMSSGKKQILIVEDHPFFRAMLAQLINKEPDLTVCGEADNIKDALTLIEKTQPDAAILDLTLQGPSGLELIKDLKARNLSLPVLVLSMHPESICAERVLRAGARGYVSKQAPPAEAVAALRTVMDGRIYVSAELYQRAAQWVAEHSH